MSTSHPSSFSSIALDPLPLVAFSLRVPSRMAAALAAAHADPTTPRAHMVVNLLSAAQAATAVRFARADLHPAPFADTPHALSAEGLPVLDGVLGALSCRLVAAALPLHDLRALRGAARSDAAWEGAGAASELFIAEVTRVEVLPPPPGAAEDEDPCAAPLIYHRRAYATAHPLPLPASASSPPEEMS